MKKNKDGSGRAWTIAVVGGGYSGVMTAVNLLRQGSGTSLTVLLIEPRPQAGRGLAYSIWDDSMLLNVPAGNMSAFSDDPSHFLNYCKELDPSLNGGSFVSRRIYGDYLEQVLASTASASPIDLQRIHGEAVAVRPIVGNEGFRIELADGANLLADRVVLAFGFVGAQTLQFAQALAGSPNYIGNPWDFRAMDAISPGSPVAIIGTGHTAIDALFRLTSLDAGRQVFLLSRHGLLPKPHRTRPQAPVRADFPAYLEDLPATALAFMQALRREIQRRRCTEGNWRDVFNELRPHTQTIWQRWPLEERRRFLTKIRPWWDIHRHRLAPAAAARLKSQLSAGRAEVLAGQIIRMTDNGDGVSLTLRERATGEHKSLQVAAVINCTGPDYDIDRNQSALVVQLREEGLIKADALRLGLEVDANYSVIGREGKTIPGLFYVGPMLRARDWEAIAVPELRTHAKQLACHITKTIT